MPFRQFNSLSVSVYTTTPQHLQMVSVLNKGGGLPSFKCFVLRDAGCVSGDVTLPHLVFCFLLFAVTHVAGEQSQGIMHAGKALDRVSLGSLG